jgi:hypothetical protein
MLSFTELALTMAEADDYAESRGRTAWTDATDSPDTLRLAALRRGQDYIAATYNTRWASEWENSDAPEQVKYAITEAAIRELAKPGSLNPDMKRGGLLKSVGAGSAQVEFMDGAPAETVFKVIDGLLSGLVTGAGPAIYGTSTRV